MPDSTHTTALYFDFSLRPVKPLQPCRLLFLCFHGKVSAKPFDEPRIALNRIYTKRGDAGETSLVGGQRVPKDRANAQRRPRVSDADPH